MQKCLSTASFKYTANKFSILYADLKEALKQVAMKCTWRASAETHCPSCGNIELPYLNQKYEVEQIGLQAKQ